MLGVVPSTPNMGLGSAMDPTTIAQTLAAYAQPARPVTPTPASPDDIADALWGSGTPPPPLPSWLPQNVQDYIHTQPSQEEGQKAWSGRIDNEPQQPPQPQIADIQRLFRGAITRNAPTSGGFNSQQLKNLMQMPGFSGFAGGDEI